MDLFQYSIPATNYRIILYTKNGFSTLPIYRRQKASKQAHAENAYDRPGAVKDRIPAQARRTGSHRLRITEN